MSLLDYWKAIVKENGYDKLSVPDQDVLRNVYFSGAVASYGLMLSGSEDAKLSLQAELKEYVDQLRNLQVPTTD